MTVYSELDSETKAYTKRMREVIEILTRYLGDLDCLDDALGLIVRNKDFVQHLRGNGIDGREIKKMLNDWHGLKTAIYIPLTENDKKELRKVDYAIRPISALISSEVITDEERDYLLGMKKRMEQMFYIPDEKRKSGIPYVEFKMGKGNAKGCKQMIGQRAVEIYKYVDKFNTNKEVYRQNDIYNLIAELFEVFMKEKYTREEIKNFVTNNY